MELKHRDRIVQIKIVYYGPAVGGKTTNLQMLHAAAQKRHRGEFISVASTQDRTILFDLLPLKGLGFHRFEIRFQLVAVPGQAVFAATRRLVMRGADAVVFVANSAADRLEENVASVREMAEHLVANGLDPATIPLIFQHNKRDLPRKLTIEELENALNYREAPSFPAVAIRGEGVLETFGATLEHTMEHLMGRYSSLALPPDETVPSWTKETLHRVFGRTSIAGEGEAAPAAPKPGAPKPGAPRPGAPRPAAPRPAAPRPGVPTPAAPKEDRRIIRVSVPRARPATGPVPAVRGASSPAPTASERPASSAGGGGPEAAASSGAALAERYAQASLELGQALEQTREELDVSRSRLEELEHTLRAIEAVEEGAPPEEALQEALRRIMVGGGCRGATLLGAGPDRSFRLVTGVGLPHDPFLRLDGGTQVVRKRFVPLRKPALIDPEKHPDVARAVAPLNPPVIGVAAAPVRSALGLHGLVLLYYGRNDPLPSASVLGHVGNMARVLAAWFSVRRAASVSKTAVAMQKTLPQIQSAASSALALVQRAARDPRVAASSLEKVVRTLDGLVTLTAGLAEPSSRKAAPSRER